jgi:RND family efflux transporter MFP subunit
MLHKKIGAICLLIILTLTLSGCKGDNANAEQTDPKPVKVMKVKKDIYKNESQISGNVKPAKVIKSAFKVPGVVDFINVKEGDIVKEGQVLMSVQSQDYELNVFASKSQYEALSMKADSSISSLVNQAKANVDFIKTQYERVKRLYDKGAVSKKSLEELETALIVAENKYQEALDADDISAAQLNQAKAALELAQSKLNDTVLKSPINGTVVKKLVEYGETVAPGYPVVVLGRLDELEIEIGVPDYLLKKIKVGEKAKVFIYGLDKEVEGVIDNVDTIADSQTRTFGVKILIDNKDLSVKPGMIAKVNIVQKELNTILIPMDSLIKHPDKTFVFICNGDIVEEREIKVGEVLDNKIQVIEGLKENESIVVQGQYKLKSGDKVRVEVVK